jgi:hypothetical protein
MIQRTSEPPHWNSLSSPTPYRCALKHRRQFRGQPERAMNRRATRDARTLVRRGTPRRKRYPRNFGENWAGRHAPRLAVASFRRYFSIIGHSRTVEHHRVSDNSRTNSDPCPPLIPDSMPHSCPGRACGAPRLLLRHARSGSQGDPDMTVRVALDPRLRGDERTEDRDRVPYPATPSSPRFLSSASVVGRRPRNAL